MRFDRDITLVNVTNAKNANGSWSKTESSTTTFCNMMSIGTSAYMAARVSGLNADAEVQLRSCEYAGQEIAIIGGIEYSVVRASNTGEFTRLVLSKKVTNA